MSVRSSRARSTWTTLAEPSEKANTRAAKRLRALTRSPEPPWCGLNRASSSTTTRAGSEPLPGTAARSSSDARRSPSSTACWRRWSGPPQTRSADGHGVDGVHRSPVISSAPVSSQRPASALRTEHRRGAAEWTPCKPRARVHGPRQAGARPQAARLGAAPGHRAGKIVALRSRRCRGSGRGGLRMAPSAATPV